jgi:hypothetical protein
MTDTISIQHANLLDSIVFVPPADRLKFLATMLVGAQSLTTMMTSGSPTTLTGEDAARSFPLTTTQARALKVKVDASTWALIKEAVSNVQDDVGRIDWTKAKDLTGSPTWAAFAKGRLGGLHRALRGIEGVADVNPKARLFWWDDDDDGIEDGQRDVADRTLCINEPALTALRSFIGISDT